MSPTAKIYSQTPLYKAVKSGVEGEVRRALRDAAQIATINIVCDRFHGTALGLAAFEGYMNIVLLLLDRGADINTAGIYATALGMAAGSGKEEIVRLLLDRGADINTAGVYGTALGMAASFGREEIVRLLLDQGADINAVGDIYGTPLSAAACNGGIYQAVMKLLLDRGADINIMGGSYGTALGAAAKLRQNANVRLLLDRGANINIIGGRYGTALSAAANSGNREIVELLLDRGADINTVGGNYDTALGAAAYKGEQATVKLLLDRGADISAVGGNYGTALGAAAFSTGNASVFSENMPRHSFTQSDVWIRYHRLEDLQRYKPIVELLLDRGADINAVGGNYGTALGAAAFSGNGAIVGLLLERGADINAVGGDYGTALGAAAYHRQEEVVRLLLDRGADINAVGSDYGTALGAAAFCGNEAGVRLLLDRGADINAVGGKYGTALGAAAYDGTKAIVELFQVREADIDIENSGNQVIVELLLDRGADINIIGGNYGTALGAAANGGNQEILELLLDRGADINIIGGEYGTALGAAANGRNQEILELLLDRGADINIIGGEYGTALGTAASKGNGDILSVLLDRGADINIVASEYGTALSVALCHNREEIVELLLNREADINAVGGRYGTALGTTAYRGNSVAMSLLLDRGADINIGAGEYGTALCVAAYHGEKAIVSLLLDRGADINAIGGEYGTALGVAAYKGKEAIVRLLLGRGADAIHIGGFYDTVQGEYPTALDAAHSGGVASTSLLACVDCAVKEALAKAMDESPTPNLSCINYVAGRPPFPMPYTRSTSVLSTSIHHHQQHSEAASLCASTDSPFPFFFQVGESITTEQADFLCRELSGETLVRLLVSLIGIHDKAVERFGRWIQNDIRWFVSQNLDFGLAYAAARVGWKHFNEEIGFVAMQRARWLKKEKELDIARTQAIHMGSTGQELIKEPYSVMPRRIWDLRSNRVIKYRMLHSEVQSVEISYNTNPSTKSTTYPTAPFWAVTHSWTREMKKVETSINQYQWPVPLPEDIEIHDLRTELLGFGTEYIWLDVMCLRQQSDNKFLEIVRQDEWKLDVPTIGNIYRAAKGLVRYFNGLGRPFSKENWHDPRNWLRRAWTLQEIRPEDITLNGGVSQYRGCVLMDIQGKLKHGGNPITLRQAMKPITDLSLQVGTPSGCTVYQLAREMANRVAANPTDMVSGLFYLLSTNILPTYDETVNEEYAWKQCFHVLLFRKKLEILFDFPYRGTAQQWFPTWKQLIEWPPHNTHYTHAHTEWPGNRGVPEAKWEDGARLFIPDSYAICNVLLRATTENGYQLECGNKVFGFYSPYLSQAPIALNGQLFTLVVLRVAGISNWVVCKEAAKQRQKRKSNDGTEKWIEVTYLEKVGVLRTDNCHGLRENIVKINCLFF